MREVEEFMDDETIKQNKSKMVKECERLHGKWKEIVFALNSHSGSVWGRFLSVVRRQIARERAGLKWTEKKSIEQQQKNCNAF